MSTTTYDASVIGIGAMGGGMARALLACDSMRTVIGYDAASPLVEAFYQDALTAGKARCQPTSLKEAVSADTKFVIVVLQNEPQCQDVCFGNDSDNLLELMSPGSCVVISSTVTAVWIQAAADKFAAAGVHFCDCPISGGPVRARDGQLTLMAAGDEASLAVARPVLEALGQEIHIIEGGPGMGSTVKMVHQLLAGVHICVAAEALTLAAKAGLDVEQLYRIVNGAAGASWMFADRGQRMIAADADEIKSQLQIFVKDLDIVYSEAKRLQSPVPIASTALQQFIAGQSLGLSRKDDSEVVKVYEQLAGVKVARKLGDGVGDFWTMADGRMEEIYEVGDEPRHKIVLANDYVRALRVEFPPSDTTLAHRHAEDSLYFFLVEGGLDIVNHVKGSDPKCDCVEFGEIRYGTHKTDEPLIHKISNRDTKPVLCIDAEVLKKPPVTAVIPLVADKHELIKTRDKCRVYKLALDPGESVTVTYAFFHCSVILQGGVIDKEVSGPIRWTETLERGDVAWKDPVVEMKKTNAGSTTFVEFIAEWC